MSTKMTERDWELALEVFRACLGVVAEVPPSRDSQRESMLLHGTDEQALARPLPHDELVRL